MSPLWAYMDTKKAYTTEKLPEVYKSILGSPEAERGQEVCLIVELKDTYKLGSERARVEMERVLGFRGSVAGVKAEGNRIVVKVEISPK